MRVFYPSVFVRRLVHRHVIHRSPSGKDGKRCISKPPPNPFCLYFIFFWWEFIISFWEFLCFPVAEWIMIAETAARMFLLRGANSGHSFYFRSVSGIAASQRALVMMQIFCRSLPVSVSILICILTFELLSKSSANMLHVSWLTLHCWFKCIWNW